VALFVCHGCLGAALMLPLLQLAYRLSGAGQIFSAATPSSHFGDTRQQQAPEARESLYFVTVAYQ
jgi:hypothetical protein